MEFVLLLAIFLTSSGFLIAAPRTSDPPAALAVPPSAQGACEGCGFTFQAPSQSAGTIVLSTARASEAVRSQ
ncbi:hypothetical protein J2793_001877 [Paraburkholderia caledonica]|uniref:DUF2946 domain-containing protein n=1 Tax=Paraburkholderia caledonica TaxID=134536 RepID=A0AB73I910_9BURK|nr:hypothetical protein [Paraburkholderia caledonica]